MDQSPLSHVTDKELGKANADHHYRGWCIFERLVKSGTCSTLLQEAKAAHHHIIFNRLGQQHIKKDSRKAAKTSVNGERVLEDIRAILRRGLLSAALRHSMPLCHCHSPSSPHLQLQHEKGSVLLPVQAQKLVQFPRTACSPVGTLSAAP